MITPYTITMITKKVNSLTELRLCMTLRKQDSDKVHFVIIHVIVYCIVQAYFHIAFSGDSDLAFTTNMHLFVYDVGLSQCLNSVCI